MGEGGALTVYRLASSRAPRSPTLAPLLLFLLLLLRRLPRPRASLFSRAAGAPRPLSPSKRRAPSRSI
eukprot:886557-Rhodomonas_salina.1